MPGVGENARCDASRRCSSRLRALRQAKKPSRYAALFKALGDETRLEILALLSVAEGELCAYEIEEHFELSQPTISHHLKLLRDAGLLSSEKRGLWVYYALERKVLRGVLAEFKKLVE